MRILFLTHAFNSLAQRLYVELGELGHEISVEFDINDTVALEAVESFRPDLIIASGYNIAPAEVEGYLYHHPAVQEAAVVGVRDEYRGETVKAFIVPKQEARGKVTEEEIIAFGKEKMAAYKAPKIVEFIDEIPKNLTGKVLRRVLREREEEKRT